MASHPSPPAQSRSRTLLRGCVLLGALLVATLAGVAPAAATTHHVTIASYAYSPNPLNIAAGDSVTWTNTDSVGHDITVTGGPASFQSPLLSKGQSWSYTFTTAGSYSYICSVHPDMKATVVVAAPPAPAVQAPAPTAHHTMRTHVVTVPAHSPVQTYAAAPAPTPTTLATAGSSMPNQPTINPLLLVAGACVGVVVFCLLLLGSRPHPAQPDSD